MRVAACSVGAAPCAACVCAFLAKISNSVRYKSHILPFPNRCVCAAGNALSCLHREVAARSVAYCARLTRPRGAPKTQWLPFPPSRVCSWPSVRPRARRAASSSASRRTAPGRRRYAASPGACRRPRRTRAARLGLDRSNGRCAPAASPAPLIRGPLGARVASACGRGRWRGCAEARVPPNGRKARDKLGF